MSLTPEQYAVVLERAADECMDARSFDEWTGAPRGGNAILESDAAHLRALAKAMREAEVEMLFEHVRGKRGGRGGMKGTPTGHVIITLPQEAP